MKQDYVNRHLDAIKDAIARHDYSKARRLGMVLEKKLPLLAFTPMQEYQLYSRLGTAYYVLAEYSKSLDLFYKARLLAVKHNLGHSSVLYSSFRIGNNLLLTRNIAQALRQFRDVEQYYLKHEKKLNDPGGERYVSILVDMAYCYIYMKDFENARGIIERLEYLEGKFPDLLYVLDYNHVKGEYYFELGEIDRAYAYFQTCVETALQAGSVNGRLEAEIHLAAIDLLKNRYESALRTLQKVFRDARRVKSNDLICEAGLLLCKYYSLKNMPEKEALIERRIKPILKKIDVVWLYEKTREFEHFYRQLKAVGQAPGAGENEAVPKVLTNTIERYRADSSYKDIIIGNSLPMQSIFRLIDNVAATDMPVLVQGETGTGKELIARLIHQNSRRAKNIWLALNCGALSDSLLGSHLFGHTKGAFTGAFEEKKGYIEIASGGTLLLDEISDMSPDMQQKLLRVIEEKQVWPIGSERPVPINTRFIFASNQNVEELIKKGRFREDLFYRINTITISMPALRERKEDLLMLVNHFVKVYSSGGAETKVSEGFMGAVEKYIWPGNIRELENEIKRICILYKEVKTFDETMLSDYIRNCSVQHSGTTVGTTLKQSTNAFQRNLIIDALRKNSDDINKTAVQLGFNRSSFYRKLKQLQIKI